MKRISRVSLPVFAVLVAALASACGPRPPAVVELPPITTVERPPQAPETTPPPRPCPAVAGFGDPVTRLTIGLADMVDPGHAPVATNDSERLLFRQLYETLVSVDCEGRVAPALAATWSSDPEGRVWTFFIRPAATFTDGTPVTAEAIVASWRAARSQGTTPGFLQPWSWIRSDSLTAGGDGTLRVALTAPVGDEPSLFAHPSLGVTHRVKGRLWPVGTGPYAVAQVLGDPPTLIVSAPDGRDATSAVPELRFRVAPARDLRDLLPRVDLFVSGDDRAVEYARSLGGYRVVPLPFDRTYAFLSPELGARGGGASATHVSETFQARLADDAASKLARSTFASETSGFLPCPGNLPPRRTVPLATERKNRIVFPRYDDDAGRLANRLAALTRAAGARELPAALQRESRFLTRVFPPGEDWPVTLPLDADALARTLAEGGDAAYVLALRRSFPDSCLQASAILLAASWVRSASSRDEATARRGPSRAVVPLIDTRLLLVYRRPLVAVAADWDGTPLLRHTLRAPRESTP